MTTIEQLKTQKRSKNEGIMSQTIETPWGKAQCVTNITDWLIKVSTSSHGGLRVSQDYNQFIPNELRDGQGWYEEDCAWSIVVTFLEKFILVDCWDYHSMKTILHKDHIETFKRWYPDYTYLLPVNV